MPADERKRAVSTNGSTPRLRWPFILICCLPLLRLRIWMLISPHSLYDFVTYWASGHLFLTGDHPYSNHAMLVAEQALGWQAREPMMTFCPPWVLPIVALFARLPFFRARMVWLVVSVLLNCASSVGLWIYFGGERKRAWIALLACATFIPMGGAELLGQITPIMLASLTAFLLLIEKKQLFAAGVVTLGFGFKPHLLYLVAAAALFWIVKKRAWSLIAGGALAYATAFGAALLFNPNSADYLHSVHDALDVSCGLGWLLRSFFGFQHRWLQFVPCFFGALWVVYYWSKKRETWDWKRHLPLLLLVSISTSPYFWFHDFTLALPAILALAVREAYRYFNLLVAYLVLQSVLFAADLPATWMAVLSVLWTALYYFGEKELRGSGRDTVEDPGIPRGMALAVDGGGNNPAQGSLS